MTVYKYFVAILSIGLMVSDISGIFLSENVKSENLKTYPIWKIKQNNQIDFKPIPLFLVYPSNVPKASDDQVNNTGDSGDVKNLTEKNQISSSGSATTEEINELARLVGVSPSMLPSIKMAMELLGTTTEAETIQTIREIASTPEGIDLIRSFSGSRAEASENIETFQSPQSQPPSLSEISPVLDNVHTDLQIVRNVYDSGVQLQAANTDASPSLFSRVRKLFTFPNFAQDEQVASSPPPPLPTKYYITPPPHKPIQYYYPWNQNRNKLAYSPYGDQIQYRPSMKQYTIMAPDVDKRPQNLLYLKNTNRKDYDQQEKYVGPSKPIRNESHDFYATGKIHRAKPDAIKLLPLTVHQQMVASQKQIDAYKNDHDETMINRINDMTKEGLKP